MSLSSITSGSGVTCSASIDTTMSGLVAKLPPGWAWEGADVPGTLMYGLFRALAAEFYELESSACSLLPEFNCHTATATVPSWNADYGIPDDCGLNDLCAKVIAQGNGRAIDLIELGAALGYDLCVNELSPELQAGCWEVGCDQLGPPTTFTGGGSELGFAPLGECPDDDIGSPLGQSTLASAGACNIAGYFVDEPEVTTDNPCDYDVNLGEFTVAVGAFLAGRREPIKMTDYAGTAHHFLVGLTSDNPEISGVFGSCEPTMLVGDDGFELGIDSLGVFTPGTAVPNDYSIAGCWETGCTPLCAPSFEPVMCFVLKFRHAHLVPIRRYACS